MKKEIFRAYDIRGVYPEEINEEMAYTLGQSYGSYLIEKYNTNKCVVSHDNRLSSDSLTENLINGILDSGCDVTYLGLTTTPMNYYARHLKKCPGIMVTASHNPKDDNGFKFSFDGIVNARGEMITDFCDYTLKENFRSGHGNLEKENIEEEYSKYLKDNIHFGSYKKKIVLDPGNGALCNIIKKVFSNFEHEIIYINDISDGTFPNHHPDPAVAENMKQLQDAVIQNNADFGIGFDGDGDRIGIVMEDGNLLPIEYFMIMMIKDIFPAVQNKTFLYDIKCSKSVEDVIKTLGGKPLCYRTGASYSEYKVQEDKIPFGAEYSGHVFFTDRNVDSGSALYASLRFMEVMSKTNEKLSDIIKDFPFYYSTPEIKISSPDDKKFEVVEKICEYAKANNFEISEIDGVRMTFENGWALVRASNTGPNLIFRAEASTKEEMERIQKEYLDLINKYNK